MKNSESGWALGVVAFGIVFFLIGVLYFGPTDKPSNYYQENDTVYYNIPIYTTVYEIVYPDSTYRYTCTSHIKLSLDSWRGTNTLQPNYPLNWRYEKPEWWDDEWEEPRISTTAPIRIVSETVTHKKTKYIKRR